MVLRLSSEVDPLVECPGTLVTATTGLDAHRISDSLDGIAQTYFFLDEETRKANAMRLLSCFFRVILFVILFSLIRHDTFLPLWVEAIS